ncbi:MAG: phosphopantetheine-binding protein [Cyclobacteriaceae bacterium]
MENISREKIRKFIESNLIIFDEDIEIGDEDNIFKMGYVNSLFAMKLLKYVEKEFDIIVENDEVDINNFSSVENIVRLVDKKSEKA